MKYNSMNSEFYLEAEDVINNSPITQEELQQVIGYYTSAEKLLKEVANRVYMELYLMQHQGFIEKNKRGIEYLLFTFERYQRAMMKAQLEFLKGVINSAMDANAYVSVKEKSVPDTVYQALRQSGLVFKGPLHIEESLLEGDF